MAQGGPFGDDQLWTVAEVAAHMRVSNMTIYRLIKSGDLPAIRVGKNYRIRGRDLQHYLDSSTTTHKADEAQG
jgi:excisionase family DNA binding protein